MRRNRAQNRENRIESRFAGESTGFPAWCNHIASHSTSPRSAAYFPAQRSGGGYVLLPLGVVDVV